MPEKEKTIRIYFLCSTATVDPVQYKPTSPTFLPQSIRIAVDVPNNPRYILECGETITMTPYGYAWALKQICLAQSKVVREE